MGARIAKKALRIALSDAGSWSRATATAALLAVTASVLGACASSESRAVATGTPVPITNVRDVAGRWAGPVNGLPGPRQDEDWVQLTIAEDGTCAFAAARTIGVFGGKGPCGVQDGKLVMRGERGSATFTLLEGAGGRRLRGDGVASGNPIWADLTPAR